MCFMFQILIFVVTFTSTIPQKGLFREDVDSLLNDAIGDIHKERQKWTTTTNDAIYDIDYEQRPETTTHRTRTDAINKIKNSTILRNLKKQKMKMIENGYFSDIDVITALEKNIKDTLRKPTVKFPPAYRNVTVKKLKLRKRLRTVMAMLNDRTSPIPNFDGGEDDPAMMTRRVDALQENFRRHRNHRLRVSVGWRRDLYLLYNHFIHATRYKLVYPQALRKKYYHVTRYRIGYCFGLLTHLKKQQMYLWTTLEMFHMMTWYQHIHLRLYEKVIRLDIDIKDVLRMVKTLEARRRIESDPKYYDIYYEDESTTTTKRPGVEHVEVTQYTMPRGKHHGNQGPGQHEPPGTEDSEEKTEAQTEPATTKASAP